MPDKGKILCEKYKDWDGIHHEYEASFPRHRIYVDLYGPLPAVDEAYIQDRKAQGMEDGCGLWD